MITETTQVTNSGLFTVKNVLIATGFGGLLIGGVWYYRKYRSNKDTASVVPDVLNNEDKSNGDDKDESE